MKLKDNFKTFLLLFACGILAGVVCRLTDLMPYDNLWGFPSMATLFGFWIASVGVITYLSSSNLGAFINSFLYMFGMTASFYGLKYILGFYVPFFSNAGVFQTRLFLIYSALSVVCGLGSFVLYFWNRDNLFASFLYALPAGGMAAEAFGCLVVLFSCRRLLAQTIFDIVFALIFAFWFYKKVKNKLVYLSSILLAALAVYFVIYAPGLRSL